MKKLCPVLLLFFLSFGVAAQGPSALEEALSLKEEGKCPEAIGLLEGLAPSPEVLLALGECLEEEANYPRALDVWQKFLSLYPQDSRAPLILLRMGRLYKIVNNLQAALQAYLRHAWNGGPFSELAWEEAGDLYREMGHYQEAVKAYREALKLKDSIALREKVIETLVEGKEYKQAQIECANLEKVPIANSVRPRMYYKCGKVHKEAGNLLKAYSLFRRAIELSPESYYAYLSLVELVEAGEPVDDYLRGLVDYHACFSFPQACGAALLAFERYTVEHPKDHKAEVHYYAAIIYRELGDYQASLREWDWLIQTHPDSPLVPEGWWEKGRTLELAGRSEEAIALYRKLAENYPNSPFALKALQRAASLAEKKGAFNLASEFYLMAAEIVRAPEEKSEAKFRAGLAFYRAGELTTAIDLWKELGDSRACFWMGKALMKQGKWAEARARWWRAYQLAPENYYGLRALASLRRFSFASGFANVKQGENFSYEALKEWVGTWAPTSPEPVNDPRLLWAEALMTAGYRDEALSLYRSLYRESQQNPHALTFLAFYFREKKLYSLSIQSAMALIRLARKAGASPPPGLWELAYPLFFARLLEQEASSWRIDPLLLAAVIRQESLFDPWANSPAGAIGLMQIIPSTGKSIASALGWSGFSDRLLEKPWVSLKFGTWYLVQQKEKFGHWFAALAAYNAGPARAATWWREAAYDPDLFVELIPIEETKRYIKAIYEQYAGYAKIYQRGE